MNGELGLGDKRGLGFECQMLSFAPNSSSVIVPADRKHQPGQGDPGPGVLRGSLVLLAVPGRDLLIAHEPLQLGRRVGTGGDALKLQVLSGSCRDLGGAGVVADALNDDFARRLCREQDGILIVVKKRDKNKMCLTFLFMAVNFEFVATQRNLRKKESELGRESARERVRVCE